MAVRGDRGNDGELFRKGDITSGNVLHVTESES
jgi:hypothetical protein